MSGVVFSAVLFTAIMHFRSNRINFRFRRSVCDGRLGGAEHRATTLADDNYADKASSAGARRGSSIGIGNPGGVTEDGNGGGGAAAASKPIADVVVVSVRRCRQNNSSFFF